MSQLSRELMASLGIRQKLRLGRKLPKGGAESTGPHKVVFKADKEVIGKDYKLDDGTFKKDYIRYLFIENGEEKVYQTKKFGKDGTLSYFIQHFAEIEPNDEVVLEMKKSATGNYIDIQRVGVSKGVDISDDDIDDDSDSPTIE